MKNEVFKPKSVLNTDGFDRRTYSQLRDNAPKLTTLENEGKQKTPTFDHLMSDIWAGLYKNEPRLLDEDGVPEKVKPNRPIMESVMQHQNFTELREHCRLDEMASALGLLHMGEKMDEFLDKNLDQDTKKQMQDYQQQQQKAQQHRDKVEVLEEALQNASDKNKQQELKKQVANEKRNATRAENKANEMAGQVNQVLNDTFNSQEGQKGIAEVLAGSQKEAKEDKEAINSFISGLGYGTQPGGDKTKLDPANAIQLAEKIRNSKKLRKISKLAGRMKKIAQKKQKSKTRNSTESSDVTLGNEIEQLLPQETAYLTMSQGTRKDFLKRYSEEKLMQYSPDAKEKLGKGPIVVCIDTSGSMKRKDAESKAIMLALLGIAKKQKRAFAVINFSSYKDLKVWEYPKPKKLKTEDIITMAEWFYSNGTDFEVPLDAAARIISKSKYKKADAVFITDGDANVGMQWLEDFIKLKKEKKFSIISVQLGNESLATLKQFSDQVIKADSLIDDTVTDSVLAI